MWQERCRKQAGKTTSLIMRFLTQMKTREKKQGGGKETQEDYSDDITGVRKILKKEGLGGQMYLNKGKRIQKRFWNKQVRQILTNSGNRDAWKYQATKWKRESQQNTKIGLLPKKSRPYEERPEKKKGGNQEPIGCNRGRGHFDERDSSQGRVRAVSHLFRLRIESGTSDVWGVFPPMGAITMIAKEMFWPEKGKKEVWEEKKCNEKEDETSLNQWHDSWPCTQDGSDSYHGFKGSDRTRTGVGISANS